MSDPDCRPCAFHLTPGQDADITAAPALLALAPSMGTLIADKGYDGDHFRTDIVSRGAKPVIPNKSNRVNLHRFNKRAYKGRNVIERCFCRLDAVETVQKGVKILTRGSTEFLQDSAENVGEIFTTEMG